MHWDGCDATEPYSTFIITGEGGEPEINADVERDITACDAVADDEFALMADVLDGMRRALQCPLALVSRVLGDYSWAASAVVELKRSGASVLMDGQMVATNYPRDRLYAVEPSERKVGDRVRVSWVDDAAPLTKRRWSDGKIAEIDKHKEHKKLVSVDFDNGEKMSLQPLFEFELVSAARPSKRARRCLMPLARARAQQLGTAHAAVPAAVAASAVVSGAITTLSSVSVQFFTPPVWLRRAPGVQDSAPVGLLELTGCVRACIKGLETRFSVLARLL